MSCVLRCNVSCVTLEFRRDSVRKGKGGAERSAALGPLLTEATAQTARRPSFAHLHIILQRICFCHPSKLCPPHLHLPACLFLSAASSCNWCLLLRDATSQLTRCHCPVRCSPFDARPSNPDSGFAKKFPVPASSCPACDLHTCQAFLSQPSLLRLLPSAPALDPSAIRPHARPTPEPW